jgi:hypothetical protein
MKISELFRAAEPARQTIRATGKSYAHAIETCLDVSARHAISSRLGVDLYADPSRVEDLADSASTQTAAQTLVAASGLASIDLSASAYLRLKGRQPPAGEEHDFGKLRRLVEAGKLSLSGGVLDWFDAVASSEDGKLLEGLRHAAIHRVVRQDATVGGVRTRHTIAPATADGSEADIGDADAAEVLRRLATFVEVRWLEFWQAVV